MENARPSPSIGIEKTSSATCVQISSAVLQLLFYILAYPQSLVEQANSYTKTPGMLTSEIEAIPNVCFHVLAAASTRWLHNDSQVLQLSTARTKRFETFGNAKGQLTNQPPRRPSRVGVASSTSTSPAPDFRNGQIRKASSSSPPSQPTPSPLSAVSVDVLDQTSDRALLVRLAAPSYIAMAMDPIAAFVDLFWIGRLGPMPLAGAAVGGAVYNSVVYLFGYISYTSNALVAKALMAKEQRAGTVSKAVACSVFVALYLGFLVACPIAVFAPRLVRLMGAGPLLVADATGYLRSRAIGMPFLVVFFALSGVFRGLADLSRPLYASFLGNAVNVILDPVLMFAPIALGTYGAGLATSAACLVSVLYLVMYLIRSAIVPAKAWLACVAVPRRDVGSILGPLLALSLKRVMENGALALACSQAAGFGPASAAGMEIARQVWWTVGVLWWPLCSALAAVISMAVARDGLSDKSRVKSIARLAVGLTGALGLFGATGTALLAGYIPLLFLREPTFVATATEALYGLAPLLVVSSLVDASDTVLIAGGHGVMNTLTTCLSVAAFVALMSLLKISTLSGIWNVLVASYLIRLGLNMWRYRGISGASWTYK